MFIDQLARLVTWRVAVIVSCAVLFAVVMTIKVIGTQQDDAQAHLEVRTFTYCLAHNGPRYLTDCDPWATTELSIRRDKIATCDAQSPTLDGPFAACLIGEGIKP